MRSGHRRVFSESAVGYQLVQSSDFSPPRALREARESASHDLPPAADGEVMEEPPPLLLGSPSKPFSPRRERMPSRDSTTSLDALAATSPRLRRTGSSSATRCSLASLLPPCVYAALRAEKASNTRLMQSLRVPRRFALAGGLFAIASLITLPTVFNSAITGGELPSSALAAAALQQLHCSAANTANNGHGLTDSSLVLCPACLLTAPPARRALGPLLATRELLERGRSTRPGPESAPARPP
jgi:hypothetical protein